MHEQTERDNSEERSPAQAVPSPPTEAAEERVVMVDRRIDMAVSAGLAAIGAGLIAFSTNIPSGSIPDPIGADGFPLFIGGFLVLAGGVMIVRRLLSWRRTRSHLVPSDGSAGDEPGFRVSSLRAVGMYAAGWVWAVLLPLLGYLVPTFLLAATGIAAMKVRSPWKLVLVPLLFSIVTWLLFNRVFGIQFPAGPIEHLGDRYIPEVG